jgi:general secretion pathway protein K
MTMPAPHDVSGQNASRRTASEGFILIAALWLLAALATLATIFSIYLANTAVSLSLNDGSIQTEALVSASLELTAYQLTVPKPATTPTRGAFSFRLARANVAVNFISEAARIDLNAAPPQLLANFFASLGAQRQDAERIAERIEGWRAKPRVPSNSTSATNSAASQEKEDSLYRAAGLNYLPRRAPFAHVDELSLVVDVPAALIERAKPFLTVYGGRPQINVLDAAPEVLAAIPEMTPDLLNALSQARGTVPDPQFISGMLGPLQGVATIEGSNAYRVQIRIRFDSGRQEESEVVILSGIVDKPYRVLSWRDGVDASSIPIQPGARPR